ILYVNYFGICHKNQSRILNCFNPNQVIFDHSQAFFQPPLDCAATIYSPRKFFGIPDGGLLLTKIPLQGPEIQDCDSLSRSSHLLKRLALSPEAGYSDYKTADESLIDLSPKRMSQLTEKIYQSLDHEN